MTEAEQLQDALDRAQAEVARLQREIAAGPCREYGHDWQLYGGANAGCGDGCGCSVPVNKCSKCGDYDYGDNDEARLVRSDCAAQHPGDCECPECWPFI